MAVRLKHCICLGLALVITMTTLVDSSPNQQEATPLQDPTHPNINNTDKPENSTPNATEEFLFGSDEDIRSPFDGFIPGYRDLPISMLNASGKLNAQMVRDVRSIVAGFAMDDSDSSDRGHDSSNFGGFFDSFHGALSADKGAAEGGVDLTSMMLGLGKSGSDSSENVGGFGLASILRSQPGKSGGIYDLVKMVEGLGLGSKIDDVDNDAPGGANLDLMMLMEMFTSVRGAGPAVGGGSDLGSLVGSIIGSQKETLVNSGNFQNLLGGIFAGLSSKTG